MYVRTQIIMVGFRSTMNLNFNYGKLKCFSKCFFKHFNFVNERREFLINMYEFSADECGSNVNNSDSAS